MSNEVIRECDWIDGKDPLAVPFKQILNRLMSGEYSGRCISCGVPLADDMKCPTFAIELERKSDNQSSGDIEFSSCHACESSIDSLLDNLEATR